MTAQEARLYAHGEEFNLRSKVEGIQGQVGHQVREGTVTEEPVKIYRTCVAYSYLLGPVSGSLDTSLSVQL